MLKSRDLEKHLLQAHLSCKYGPNGCEFTGTRGHLLWHEDECVFRMVQCPDGKCEMSVKVSSHKKSNLKCKIKFEFIWENR